MKPKSGCRPVAKLTFDSSAKDEYRRAIAYYRLRNRQAAAKLVRDFAQAVEFIRNYPEASPLCDDRHRYCSPSSYPYAWIYRVAGDQIYVVAVSHHHQELGDWSDRG